jgi:Secretion system C-terminal sorting domain
MMKKTTPIVFFNYCFWAKKRISKILLIAIGFITSFTLSASGITNDTKLKDSPKAPISLGSNSSMKLPNNSNAKLNTKIVTGSDVTSAILSGVVTYNLKGFAIPVIQATASSQYFGCNPPAAGPRFTVMDDCSLESSSDVKNLVVDNGGVIITGGCNRSQTWTATYSNACDFSAEPVSITYTWIEIGTTTITTTASSGYIGCNPTIIAPIFAVGNTCGANLNIGSVTSGVVNNGGCSRSQTWTSNSFEDGCGSVTELISVTYTWIVSSPPIITTTASSGYIGCNPLTITAPIFTVIEECEDGEPITLDPTSNGEEIDGCNVSQTWTARYRNYCGLEAEPVSITYRWKVAVKPIIMTSAANRDLGCNPPTTPPEFTVDDECDEYTSGYNNTYGVVTRTSRGEEGSGCNRSQTWTGTYTNSCGMAADNVSITYTWKVATKPTIKTTASSRYLGCNPTAIPIPMFTVTDACNVSAEPTVKFTDVIEDGCNRSKTWTADYGSSCSLEADLVSITYTWKVATKPTITPPTGNGNLGCNPTEIPTPSFTVTDACNTSAEATVRPSTVVATGCSRSQTWTANYTNDCGIADPVSFTYRWTIASTPSITANSASRNLGCNPSAIPIPSFTVTDACNASASAIISRSTESFNGCDFRYTVTARYTNSCNISANNVSVVYTWRVAERPVISTSSMSRDLGCNPTVLAPRFTVSDACNSSAAATVTPSIVTANGCNRSQTWTASYTNSCGIPADNVSITYTWNVAVIPIISTTARNLDLGCNPTEFPIPIFTVRDDCNSAARPIVYTGSVIVNGCNRSQTWTAIYTNSCGINASNVRITNTWRIDVTPPVIGALPGLTTIDCEDEPVFIRPSTNDACGGPVNLTFTSTTTSTCKYTCTVVRKWTATDVCDNTSMASQTIVIEDKRAPFIDCPKNVVVDASLLPAVPCEDLGGGSMATVIAPNNANILIDDSKIDFRQPRNQGHPAVPLIWTNGVNSKTQSEFFEGMGVPQRIVFTGLTGTKHTFRFRHEAVKHQSGDKHGYDFLMSWEQAIKTASDIGNGGLNELKNLMDQACDGNINGMSGSACADLNSVAYATPTDAMGNPPNHHGNNSVNNAITRFESKYGDRKIEMRGNAPISDYSIAFDGYSGKDDDDNYAWYTISWTSSSDNVMIKLAGRIAQGSGDAGYGECYGAADERGEPYHFRLEQLDDKSLVNNDNQIVIDKGCNVNKPVTFVTPYIYDNCSSFLVPEILKTEAVFNLDGSKTHTRTWKATDDCGNSSTCMQSVTVVCGNNTSLTIVCPKDGAFSKLADMPDAKPNLVSITSDCGDDNPIILAKTENTGTGCATDPHIRMHTYTVKNICGNEATCVQQFKGIYNLSMGVCSKTDACENATGSVTAGVINNAVGPVVYRWLNAAYDVVGNTPTVSNLPAGTYYLWLRDDCMLVTDEVTINNVKCETITQNIVGGKPNHTLVDKLVIVPNPASTQVDLSFNTDIESNSIITITDLSGRIVRKLDYKTTNGFNKTIIPLDNIVNGGYIISVKLGNQQLTERLFIIK